MKTLLALLLIAALGWAAWRMSPLPQEQPRVHAPPVFAYGIGSIEELDPQRGWVTIRTGPHAAPVVVSYFAEDKGQLAGLRPAERVEFQLRHDGNKPVVTDIKPLAEESDQAGVPACVSALMHSGRASLSQTASARSAAPPSAT